jgi:Flp pilus assembly protein TadB
MSFDIPLSMIVELTLAVLLAATLVCCFSVDRRLKRLRSDQESLNGTVQALNAAIISASAGVAKLRAAAAEADKTLGGKVSSARALVDELSLLTAACERIATRMEGAQKWNAPARAETLRAVR